MCIRDRIQEKEEKKKEREQKKAAQKELAKALSASKKTPEEILNFLKTESQT